MRQARSGNQDGRNTPEESEPIVIVAKINNELKIVSLDDGAARLGLVEDMPLATARAMHPALCIVERDAEADARTLNAIADWCDRFTPLVALDGGSGLFLDISGCAHLFGGEACLMQAICRPLARQGFAVSAGIAGTAVAARALAQSAHGRIVPPGQEADAVINLPVATLGVDSSVVTALRRAGLRSIGDVASRSRGEITARFGADFTEVLRQALGQSDAPISPRQPLPDYVAEQRFADPVATSDVILRTLRKLAEVLVGAMERHGKGARQLTASFFRTDGAMRLIAIEAGQAVTDAAVAERLFVERIDALADPLDPGFGFDLIRLAAVQTVAVTSAQYGFDTRAHEAADVAAFVDRLSARLGSRRIIHYQPHDTHIPERAELAVPAQHGLSTMAWPQRIAAEPPRRPLRLLLTPERIDVTAQFPHGPPAMFKWRQLARRIVRTEGPERIAMEWWRWQEQVPEDGDDEFEELHPPQGRRDAVIDGERLTRDYFRAEDGDGLRYWIYREGIYLREVPAFRWFMHGLFA